MCTDRVYVVRESQGKGSFALRSGNVRERQGKLQWSGGSGTFMLYVRENILFLSVSIFLLVCHLQSQMKGLVALC